jgi:hypothetical protein
MYIIAGAIAPEMSVLSVKSRDTMHVCDKKLAVSIKKPQESSSWIPSKLVRW